jgi:hypothetical protein
MKFKINIAVTRVHTCIPRSIDVARATTHEMTVKLWAHIVCGGLNTALHASYGAARYPLDYPIWCFNASCQIALRVTMILAAMYFSRCTNTSESTPQMALRPPVPEMGTPEMSGNDVTLIKDTARPRVQCTCATIPWQLDSLTLCIDVLW